MGRVVSGAGVETIRAGDDEADILAALDAGDVRRAGTLMVTRFGDRVFDYCSRYLSDDTLAADVQQITLIQAYQSLKGFNRRSRLRTWLFKIATHRCLDALKSARRAKKHVTSDDVDVADPNAAGGDRSLNSKETARALEECLDRLPEQVRMAVLLRHHEDLSFEQMAEIFGEKPGTLQARVARAKSSLKTCLERKGATP